MEKIKAIFFDRDNTLIFDKGYMYKIEDLKFFPKTFEVLRELKTRGYKFFIFSNQSGIGRGYFEEKDMHRFHAEMEKHFNAEGIEFVEYLFCPHPPVDNCDCRKPSPKILIEAIKKYNINPNLSYMVGDRQSDIDAGEGAGLTSILIKEDHIDEILSKIK